MGMMLPLLMILLFVGLMMCQKKDEKKEQPVTPPVQPPQPTTPERNASSACAEAGFFVCSTCPTEESLVTDLPAGEGSVCCNIPCEACPEYVPPPPTFCPNGTIVQPQPDEHGCVRPPQCVEGNKSLTCAFQKGFACKETENCPDKQFIAASDSQRCCKVQCKARVQTELVVGDLGKVVIERFGAGKFGVYYGPNVSIGGIDLGKANYADAVAKGNNVYEFKVQQKTYSFKVTKDTDIEISAEAQIPQEAYFKFRDKTNINEIFVFKLTDTLKIQQARDILSGKINDTTQVMGKIVKTPVPYNLPWSFHLDPASINFFQAAIEVCDARISYVESHLNESCGSFLPDCLWCPWSSKLIEEITLPSPLPNEREVKTYLVDKYNPGISFGMPRIISQAEIDSLLRANSELAAYVKTKYNLGRDIEVYNKMRQFTGIQLTPRANGYTFAFSDGQGCTITDYGGTVTGMPITDTVTKREQRQVPC